MPDAAGSLAGLAVDGMEHVAGAAGDALGFAGRLASRAAGGVTSKFGAVDAAQVASLPGALMETAGDALGAVVNSAAVVQPALAATVDAATSVVGTSGGAIADVAGGALHAAADVAGTVDLDAVAGVAGDLLGAAGDVAGAVIGGIADL